MKGVKAKIVQLVHPVKIKGSRTAVAITGLTANNFDKLEFVSATMLLVQKGDLKYIIPVSNIKVVQVDESDNQQN